MEEILNFEINPRTFKKFLNVIDTIFDECVFKFNAEGLQCATVDRSNVMMLDISMPKDTFSKYELKKDIEIGFNIKEFLEFLKGAKKHYTLSF
jgi:DNA polymerase III sliding clamp (beta) subunit (PCNA family)